MAEDPHSKIQVAGEQLIRSLLEFYAFRICPPMETAAESASAGQGISLLEVSLRLQPYVVLDDVLARFPGRFDNNPVAS